MSTEIPEEEREKADELIEGLQETETVNQEKQNALLEAVAEDEELVVEETEEVEIGEAIITCKTELTGDTLRKVDSVQEGVSPGEMLDTVVDVLVDQTDTVEAATEDEIVEIDTDAAIRGFYTQFINSHDAEKAATLCFKRVVEEPNELEQERRQDVHKSFQRKR